MDIYLLAFLVIVLSGSVSVYVYYLKDKNEQLNSIKRGFCPKCKQKNVELIDKRSGGCGSPSLITFECLDCGYTNSFAMNGGGSC